MSNYQKTIGVEVHCELKTKEKSDSVITEKVLFKAKEQFGEYFAGKRTRFELEYCFCGTDFQKSVWHELEKIPFGKTKTYGEVAAAIEKPKAARAVGMACNRNPILMVIPCHRVIGKNGSLTGFGAGLELKETLLNLEHRS